MLVTILLVRSVCGGSTVVRNEFQDPWDALCQILTTRENQQGRWRVAGLQVSQKGIEQIVGQPIEQSVDDQQFRPPCHGTRDH